MGSTWHNQIKLACKETEQDRARHAEIGRACGCGACFCCAALEVQEAIAADREAAIAAALEVQEAAEAAAMEVQEAAAAAEEAATAVREAAEAAALEVQEALELGRLCGCGSCSFCKALRKQEAKEANLIVRKWNQPIWK